MNMFEGPTGDDFVSKWFASTLKKQSRQKKSALLNKKLSKVEVQKKLHQLGFYNAGIDGKIGPKSRAAIAEFVEAYHEITQDNSLEAWVKWSDLEFQKALSAYQIKLEVLKSVGLSPKSLKKVPNKVKSKPQSSFTDVLSLGTYPTQAREEAFSEIAPLIDKKDYRSQLKGKYSDNEKGLKKCKSVAEKMLYRHLYVRNQTEGEKLKKDFKRADARGLGYEVGNVDSGHSIYILKEDKSKIKDTYKTPVDDLPYLKMQNSAQLAINYINHYLSQGIPVVVGVNHTYNRKLKLEGKQFSRTGYGYNNGTTDHFITLVGRGITNEGQAYYSFFDPGRSTAELGTSKILYEIGPNLFQAKVKSNTLFELSEVVLFKRDLHKFKGQIEGNKKALRQLKSDSASNRGDFAFRQK